MDLSREVGFVIDLAMSQARALEFVRDVPRSLSLADFLADLQVLAGKPRIVAASLPVSAALFGQHELPFRSELHDTGDGARLVALPLTPTGPGWAEVSGAAKVSSAGASSRVDYQFAVTVHLKLPEAAAWGERALTKLIAMTAESALRNVVDRFPSALAGAAAQCERARA